MFTFLEDLRLLLAGGAATAFFCFFCYVYGLWGLKWGLASRCRPVLDPQGKSAALKVSVIAPVYNEDHELFRRVLASVRANCPDELVVVVDGGDRELAALAERYADTVLTMPKLGKREAIARGLAACSQESEIVVVLDSDTVWAPNMLEELRKPFADPRVGGVTPKQAIFERERNLVRRFADWIEDLRYSLTVPAQSVLGQIGCLAGRTIAYRRQAFEPAVRELRRQRVFGLEMTIGDDRVLTNVLLRDGWRTVYQPSALVLTDAPERMRDFYRQQLRWGRSSQRETFLSLPWLWRRPFTLLCFASDIAIPLALYGIFCLAIFHTWTGSGRGGELAGELALAYLGMLTSIGVRQLPHLRRYPADTLYLPLFVLALTFVMAPLRIAALATMFHNSWGTRTQARPLAHAPQPTQERSEEVRALAA